MTLHVFVGYDMREHAAWMVCESTLRNPLLYQGEVPLDVQVHPLAHRPLRRAGSFDRPWRIDEDGQTWDVRDGRPFSTEFSHSRFLVPHLAKEMGLKGPVVFVDCDFLFLRPITEMLATIDRSKVLSVIKHDFDTIEAGTKMDGMAQTKYFRKLWSSLMVFNMSHPDIDLFDHKHLANTWDGSSLHGFTALEDAAIGSIDGAWNHIPGHSAETDIPNAIHWSFGGPWMRGYEKTPWASQWRTRYFEVMHDALENDLSSTFPIV